MTVCVLRGRSMRPFLREGDILLVRPFSEADARPGRILVFADRGDGSKLLVHRVVRTVGGSGRVVTRGDACWASDGVLDPAWIRGRVAAVWRGGRARPVRRADEIAGLAFSAFMTAARRLWPRAARLAERLGGNIMDRLLKTRSDLVYRREGDEALLFDPGTGEVRLLNETGALVWEMLDGRHGRDEIVARILETFDGVEREEAERDVDEFVERMKTAGLVA